MYVNKNHRINFALDDNDYSLLMSIVDSTHLSVADVFRRLLRIKSPELSLMFMKDIADEIHVIRTDLLKCLRS